MTRLKLFAAAVALLVLASATIAQARSYPKPPLGAWQLEAGAGFTLKNGSGKSKGQVVLSNLHFRSPGGEYCPAQGSVKVLGSYPLKLFRRGGYSAWGVGKNAGGEPTYMAAKMVVGGKTESGSFFLLWNYQDPSQVFSGGAKFGECTLEFFGGGPK
ncbi:MAG TPA: hypothetical protein VGI73_03975 [Solirubrobacterales bacterium]|jgi:hypothetical protein